MAVLFALQTALTGLGLLALALVAAPGPQGRALAPGPQVQAATVRGITISCQTFGPEWGTPEFGEELEELRDLGANWVAIHPYAGIRADGTVVDWHAGEPLPEWLSSPVQVARERGMRLLVKPHLAYWGSPFSWRGAIEFPDPEQRERFFETYRAWILSLAEALGDVDAFAVGTELDRLVEHEEEWRRVIRDVRGVTGAKLTYASNWSDYQRVPFWDALDAIGVQAYFPLVDGERTPQGEDPGEDPGEAQLLAGWTRALGPLRELHERTGKPVVFTELGYNVSLDAAHRPWEYGSAPGDQRERATALQQCCIRVALRVLEREREWLRGAFLWKWFVGPAPRANFLLDTPEIRDVLRSEWSQD